MTSISKIIILVNQMIQLINIITPIIEQLNSFDVYNQTYILTLIKKLMMKVLNLKLMILLE